MALITLTTNGQTVIIDGDLTAISAILSGMNLTIPADSSVVPVIDPIEQKAVSFTEFLSVELNKYVAGGRFFVSELNRLRQNGDNNYIPMGRVYRELVNRKQPGWAKRRQLLLTASAVWRYTFKPNADRVTLRGDIAAAIECSDCGEFATAMMQRLKQEKLWV